MDSSDDKFYEKELILKKYIMLQEAEHHYSALQYKYRQYAIYWLMGVFAGIGFLMSKEVGQGIFNQTILISIVAVSGSLGLVLLWLIDIFLYQKLLDAVHIEGTEMEERNGFLPKIRYKMFLMTKENQPLIIQTNFYIGIILLCLSVSMISLLMYHLNMGEFYVIYFIPIKILLIILIVFYVYKNIKKNQEDCEFLKSNFEKEDSAEEE